MDRYSGEELEEALKIVSSIISRCEKTYPKFEEGTSQHTLLKNRIKALNLSKALLLNENLVTQYTKEELTDALRPVSSIISKCDKAMQKYEQGTSYYTRLKKMIKAMCISKTLIINEINRRG